MAKLGIGDVAPAFTLQTDRGEAISLETEVARGPVVLVFYVLDNTPG